MVQEECIGKEPTNPRVDKEGGGQVLKGHHSVCATSLCGMRVMYVFVVYLHTRTQRPGESNWASCFIYNSRPYSLVTGFDTEPGVVLSISKFSFSFPRLQTHVARLLFHVDPRD